MGDKVCVQCQTCGRLHRVDVKDAQISDDALYTIPIYCSRCRDGTKHLLIGEHIEDVYANGNILLDERFY